MSEPTPPLRPETTEAAFRRFEPYIASALTTGTSVVVPLDGLSPHTIAARLRDALRSKRLYDWPAQFTANDVFDLMVIERADCVRLVRRSVATNPPTTPTTPVLAYVNVQSITINEPTDGEIEACIVLLHGRRIHEAVLTGTQRVHSYAQEYGRLFDVSIKYDGNITTIR